ncbi:hypothetical protein LTR56_008262 [Elasticomyces elasticus]|nr:hypothetical protein LTR56_008262 [Elasticomyces elasticus]KAK3661825.1 hypothetical protein LTR22_007408 [Elasticomyces elasticus]KAK4924429.1 hypothetical protein LTR49_008520 [Elasticomyces elasticus]
MASSESTADPKQPYLGISNSLLYTLVDVYFATAYNASLLLHKASFLESLAGGTATPHVVLSVCAWAANFYRDQNGVTTLRDHGFMVEWAKRAGNLVFQDVQSLRAESIVSFTILGLFWYTQGSWRLSSLYKGNAVLCLQTGSVESSKVYVSNSLDLEVQRRRFWACYLMQCTLGDPLVVFDSIIDVTKVALPWPEAEFAAGITQESSTYLDGRLASGTIFGELARGLTLWASAFSHIKSPNLDFGESVTGIYGLDSDLSKWWSQVQPELKLDPANASGIPKDQLSKVLLLNLIYYQSMCALHASIVPLFSWSVAEGKLLGHSAARRSSAQIAYEHACTASDLMDAVLSLLPTLNPAHSFIAYTAYSGCAIQIPFMWCSNLAVRQRATRNVQTNVRVISAMAPCWKFAALLDIHVGCLYKIHQRHAVTSTLEDEPRNANITKLLNFKVKATHARTSILGFVDILRVQGEGYVKQGEETTDLGIQDDEVLRAPHMPANSSIETDPCRNKQTVIVDALSQHSHLGDEILPPRIDVNTIPKTPPPELGSCTQVSHTEANGTFGPSDAGRLEMGQQHFDVVHPFFDPALLDIFPDGEVPDLSQFGSLPMSLTDIQLGDWTTASLDPFEGRWTL